MKEWFALHTRPYSEHNVAARLEHHDIETYVPETTGSAGNDCRIPFFPGYMFIRVDMNQANPIYWRTTPGVRYLVSYGEVPVAVDEQLIAVIRDQLDALHERLSQPRGRFTPGERVRIVNGPFRDMTAVFQGPTEPSERVHILLDVMSRARRVRIATTDLESAGEEEVQPTQRRGRRSRGRGRPIRS